MSLRVMKQQESALILSEWLSSCPAITKVIIPPMIKEKSPKLIQKLIDFYIFRVLRLFVFCFCF